MKPKLNYLIFIFLILINFNVFAQDEFGGMPKKEYQALIIKAKEFFAKEDFHNAQPLYQKLHEIQPQDMDISFRLGACYLESATEKEKSINIFENCSKLQGVNDAIYLYLGKAYHINYQFENALSSFDRFLLTASEADSSRMTAQRMVQICKNAKSIITNPIDVNIINLGEAINTPYPDYSPVITADESKLIFTSRREGSTGGIIKELNKYQEDIYISFFENSNWTKAISIGASINTELSDASVGISADGQKLLVYKDDGDNGNLYLSQLVGDSYTKPVNMGTNINTKTHELSASLTPDGNLLYFSSTRKGGLGGKDIYRSQRLPNGEWGLSQNLGPNLNTIYDEDAPFIHPDGKTLYFSSRGHNTMGGYDIFVSNIGKANYISEPINIGYPINTTGDDIFFVLSADAKHAYYSSAKKGGYGETDIYLIEMEGKESIGGAIAGETGKSQPSIVMMRGKVTDEITKIPIGAFIRITDLESSNLVGVWNANESDGKFLVILNPGKNYGIHVESEGFLFHSENVEIPITQTEFKEINKEIELKRIKKGKSIILKNIFYDSGVAALRNESQIELDKVYKMLEKNPAVIIEIAGHTDAVGSDVDNQKLSENRSNNVIDYLIERGISVERLVAKGYGESQPISTNDTHEGRQLNRRTELKVLKSASE